jgi:hypothetical protein
MRDGREMRDKRDERFEMRERGGRGERRDRERERRDRERERRDRERERRDRERERREREESVCVCVRVVGVCCFSQYIHNSDVDLIVYNAGHKHASGAVWHPGPLQELYTELSLNHKSKLDSDNDTAIRLINAKVPIIKLVSSVGKCKYRRVCNN